MARQKVISMFTVIAATLFSAAFLLAISTMAWMFLAYRDKVARIRERRGGQGARPDSQEAVAQVDAMMAAIARRRAESGR